MASPQCAIAIALGNKQTNKLNAISVWPHHRGPFFMLEKNIRKVGMPTCIVCSKWFVVSMFGAVSRDGCGAISGNVRCAGVPRLAHRTIRHRLSPDGRREGAEPAQKQSHGSMALFLVCGFVSPRPNIWDWCAGVRPQP